MSIRQINQSHRYSNVKYIVKSHNMFGIYHRMRFRCVTVILQNSHSEAKKELIIIRDVLLQVYYELPPPAQ